MTDALRYVPGSGSNEPDLIIIGEAPGAEEHEQGLPFVGRSGKLLRKLVAEAAPKANVYYTNVVKVRPENNRTPTDLEIKSWRDSLINEISSFWSSSAIVTVGLTSAKAITNQYDIAMSDLIGRDDIVLYTTVPHRVIPTYHPAYALRNPEARQQILEDLSRACKEGMNVW